MLYGTQLFVSKVLHLYLTPSTQWAERASSSTYDLAALVLRRPRKPERANLYQHNRDI